MSEQTIRGGYNKDGYIACDKCDKTNTLRFVAHGDGKDFTQAIYNCECGNVVTVKTPRRRYCK